MSDKQRWLYHFRGGYNIRLQMDAQGSSCIHSKSWRPWRPVSANFFHFPPKFRLRAWKPSRVNCTNASPSVCRLCFVFNINTFYIDLLYFDNLLLKTPDLCNLRTFVAIFFVAIYALFPPIFGGKKTDSANLSAFRMYGLFYKSCFFGVFQCDLGPPKHILELKNCINQCFFLSKFDWSLQPKGCF